MQMESEKDTKEENDSSRTDLSQDKFDNFRSKQPILRDLEMTSMNQRLDTPNIMEIPKQNTGFERYRK